MITSLVPAEDRHFAWMLGEAPAPGSLRLPEGDLDTPEVTKMLRALAARVRAAHGDGAWMMVSQGERVGMVSYMAVPAAGEVEIGYGVAAGRQAMGHATRAVAALVAQACQDDRIRSLTAATAVTNPASQAVLRKNGFLRTGTRLDPEDGELILWARTC